MSRGGTSLAPRPPPRLEPISGGDRNGNNVCHTLGGNPTGIRGQSQWRFPPPPPLPAPKSQHEIKCHTQITVSNVEYANSYRVCVISDVSQVRVSRMMIKIWLLSSKISDIWRAQVMLTSGFRACSVMMVAKQIWWRYDLSENIYIPTVQRLWMLWTDQVRFSRVGLFPVLQMWSIGNDLVYRNTVYSLVYFPTKMPCLKIPS